LLGTTGADRQQDNGRSLTGVSYGDVLVDVETLYRGDRSMVAGEEFRDRGDLSDQPAQPRVARRGEGSIIGCTEY
jgi:hypothetical protein